jgi:hypothetical protein
MASDRQIEGFCELPVEGANSGRGEFSLFEHGEPFTSTTLSMTRYTSAVDNRTAADPRLPG